MAFYHNIAAIAVLAAAASPTVTAQDLTPGAPSLSMHFVVEGDAGKVTGKITAPSQDSGWDALPADTRMRLTVVRSCYTLGETDILVFEHDGATPGETIDFTDNATPAWQYGSSYTYNAYAYIGENRNAWPGYGSMEPGVKFSFASQAVNLIPALDGKSVTVTVVVPETDYNGDPLPVPVKAIELHRVTDRTSWPYQTELITAVPDPELGSTVTLTDNDPTLNATNYYVVRAVTDFGVAETNGQCYVGLDIPDSPYPVAAEEYQGGIRIYWTAPDRGQNYGAIDPAKTFYNIYRCWGVGDNNRELIAENIKETEYVDYGTDMTFPRAVRYEVQSGNDIGLGRSNYSSYDYEYIIGPAYTLPYVESFDGGADKQWIYENSSYYARWYQGTEAEYGNTSTKVQPYDGTGLIYVDYTGYGISKGAGNTMTSYKIDFTKAVNPALSYHYYAIPGNDVSIEVFASTDNKEFKSVGKTIISQGITEAGWRRDIIPLAEYAGKEAVYVRFHTTFVDVPSSAILDRIVIADYLPVGAIETSTDSDACTVTLTWADPSTELTPCIGYTGYVNDEAVGSVSSPWEYQAAEYGKVYSFRVEAMYDGVKAPLSTPVAASITAPAVTEFTAGDYVFSVSTEAENEVWIKEYIGTRGGIVTLPSLVNNLNVTYTVTKVLAGAFRGNTKIWSLAVPEDFTEIGEEAFAECTALLGVTIGENVSKIDARAFAGCSALATVIFQGKEVPEVAADAFEGIAEGCKGTCPSGTAAAYSAVEGLSPIDFGYMGISDALLENAASVEYFDLNGTAIDAPERGRAAIVRVTGRDGSVRTAKIFVK